MAHVAVWTVRGDRVPSLADGELTPSGKIVRKAVIDRYGRKIDALFASSPSKEVIEVEQRELQRT